MLLGVCLLFQSHAPAQVKEVRRVLILNVFGPLSSPGVALLDDAIVAGLEKSPYQIELYSEDMEATLFPDEGSQRQFREWYIRKYRDRTPDVIIAVGLEPLRFMTASHESAFPHVPIIFCGVTEEMLEGLKLDSQFTGVWAVAQPEDTLKAALSLQPGTKHVVVVGGVGPYDRYLEAIARNSFLKYESSLEFTYLTGLAMPALLERLKNLPDHTIVYYTSIMRDADGNRFIDANQSVPLVAGAANAPVFVVDDVDLGKGTVGGHLLSWATTGQTIGQMAVRVLNGEKPRDIPIVKSANVYMFDWRALKRWGLKASKLPPGSIVLNPEPTAWETYKPYFIGGISLILVEGLLIFALLRQRARASRAEAELEISYDRLRMAVEAGQFVGWDLDIKKGQNRWFGALQHMLGIPSDSYYAQIGEFSDRVHPEDRDLVSQAIALAKQSRQPYTAEYRFHRSDGTVRWVNARGKFYYAADGAPERMLGLAMDITDRKLADQKLCESEARLAGIVGSAMDAIIAVDEERRILLFNAAAEKMFDCTRDEAVGTVIDRFIPERFRSEHSKHMHRFGESRTTTRGMGTPAVLWAVRTNGQEFPIEASIAHLESDGRKLFTVVLRDITERRQAEEALATMGRRLIEAHEEERTWIARELHDDINQRIALLAVELEQWNQQLPDSAVELHHYLGQVHQGLFDLGRDIQALSHRLHSSKLEYLGLVGAANSFCKELSEQHKVEIDFSHAAIPNNVPKEISLCLFRVLQETLQNAVKHSGVRHFIVDLRGTAGEIQLTVSDMGAGFDPRDALNRRGLGLISMRERLQLVKGEISIKSQPGGGTTIYARVPLCSGSDSARAAG